MHTKCITWNVWHTSQSAYAAAAYCFSPFRRVRTVVTTDSSETSIFTHGRRETGISRRCSNQPQRWKHARTNRRGFKQRPNFKTHSTVLLYFPRWENCTDFLFPGRQNFLLYELNLPPYCTLTIISDTAYLRQFCNKSTYKFGALSTRSIELARKNFFVS